MADNLAGAIEQIGADIGALRRDTGWRDLTGNLLNGWTATSVQVLRDGKWGIIRFQGLDPAGATSPYFVGGVSGFFLPGQGFPAQVGTVMARLWVPNGGSMVSIPTDTLVSSTTVQATQYVGDLAWPTTLPGDPA